MDILTGHNRRELMQAATETQLPEGGEQWRRAYGVD